MKRLLMFITAIAMMLGGMAFMAPAANADSGEFSFTVKATSFDHAEQSATIKNRKRLLVNGAQQLTWENPNHNVKVTMAQVRKAPKITTRCTAANRFTQSTQIFKKTHGARIVVLKPGSCAWNRGKRDNIRVGFRWHVKVPAVLVVDRNHRYRHAFNVVNGRLVKVCLNFIGGPVDEFADKVVQVRYALDVKYSAELEVKSAVNADVTFEITCPNGARFNTTIGASAFGYARDEILFTERTRVSVVAAKRVSLNDSSWFSAEQEAVSNAKLSITVEGSCGDNPPPPPPPPVNHRPQVEIQDLAHVEAGKTVSIEGCARDEDGDTLTVPTPTVSPESLGRIDGWRRLDSNEPTTCQSGWTAFEGTFWSNSQPTWADGHEEVATITMTATDPDGLSGQATETIRVRKVVHPET